VRRCAALLAGLALAGCSSTSIRAEREFDDPADEAALWEAESPEGFVERLGDPDEWRNEGEGDDLRMTAVWKCLEGRGREVAWRLQESGKGLRRWVVVSDTSREGECDE
jgi:hypothetical protein